MVSMLEMDSNYGVRTITLAANQPQSLPSGLREIRLVAIRGNLNFNVLPKFSIGDNNADFEDLPIGLTVRLDEAMTARIVATINMQVDLVTTSGQVTTDNNTEQWDDVQGTDSLQIVGSGAVPSVTVVSGVTGFRYVILYQVNASMRVNGGTQSLSVRCGGRVIFGVNVGSTGDSTVMHTLPRRIIMPSKPGIDFSYDITGGHYGLFMLWKPIL